MSPSIRSDWSGAPLEGSTAATPIRITFPDGSERNLTVSAAEAHSLGFRGVEVSSRWQRLGKYLRAHPVKVIAYTAAAFVTGVLIPAFVHQWSDRQKELELKNGLVTAITELFSETPATALVIRSDVVPEAKLRRKAEEEFESAKPGKEKTAAQARLRNAGDEEAKAEQTLFNETFQSLLKNGGAYQARLDTYFGHTDVPKAWGDAREARGCPARRGFSAAVPV